MNLPVPRPGALVRQPFTLEPRLAIAWLNERGLNPRQLPLTAARLAGGVSAEVIAVRGPAFGMVLKQALPRLRVADLWEANPGRTDNEARAMQLFGELTPGAVPQVRDHDPDNHLIAMELLPTDARNWQEEIGSGRSHASCGGWAGRTLAAWHVGTSSRPDVLAAFDDPESFEQLRLRPFHETVIDRLPELAPAIAPLLDELRHSKRCLVDGDFAPKNIVVSPKERCWKLDFEVVHTGNPAFDLAFFLSFSILSAIQWPELTDDMRALGDGFLAAYHDAAGVDFAGDPASIAAHTACLILARTDGLSPARFLDEGARRRARAVAAAVLRAPERGVWAPL
jgi:hypothetical protein